MVRDRQHCHALGGRRLARAAGEHAVGGEGAADAELELQQLEGGARVLDGLGMAAELREHGAEVEVGVGGLVRRLVPRLDLEGTLEERERHLRLAAPPVVARDVVERDRVQGLVAAAERLGFAEQVEAGGEAVLLEVLHRQRVGEVGDLTAQRQHLRRLGRLLAADEGERAVVRLHRLEQPPLRLHLGAEPLELVDAERRAVLRPVRARRRRQDRAAVRRRRAGRRGARLRLPQLAVELAEVDRVRAVGVEGDEELVDLLARALQLQAHHRAPELLRRDHAVAVEVPLAEQIDDAGHVRREHPDEPRRDVVERHLAHRAVDVGHGAWRRCARRIAQTTNSSKRRFDNSSHLVRIGTMTARRARYPGATPPSNSPISCSRSRAYPPRRSL